MSYKEKIQSELKKALNGSLENVLIERTKTKEHGDVATNIAMILAKEQKRNPIEIANEIKAKIKADKNLITSIEVAKPGFINFVVGDFALCESLCEVIKVSNEFGFAKPKTKEKLLVEYVSANPTGDLHIGHGRQAAIGDSLSRLLEKAGYDVWKEFYINDYGEQIEQLSNASWEIYKKLQGESYKWSEDFYPELMLEKQVSLVIAYPPNEKYTKETLGIKVKDTIRGKQQGLLGRLEIRFDKWFSETDLHKSGEVERVLNELKKKGVTYEHEGALWFKAQEFQDVRDRVLIRSDKRPTYLLADIAYHIDKLKRGNKSLITIWGADHHGQEVSLKGGLKALGYDENSLEIIFVQLVSLKKDGKEVKMSKRAGTVVNLEELLNEYQVSPDAVRYFLVENHPNTRMIFDIDLAKKQDKENPVYYIQYAHARCCSIFRQVEAIHELPLQKSCSPDLFMNLFSTKNEEYVVTKSLILKILDFPEEVEHAAKSRAPSRIANYLKDLAGDFHQFYTVCRVISDNEKLTKARLGLVEATKITIHNGLEILGITAPESM